MPGRDLSRGLPARIGREVLIGPSVRIEPEVVIGDRTRIGPFAVIRSGVRIGRGCQIDTGAVLGVKPQDRNFKDERSYLVIGNRCQIREFATVSLATGKGKKTVIGPEVMVMSYCHIGHNAKIGKRVVITSGSQIGGYVEIGEMAIIGGLSGVHQFCRIGRLAMLGGCSYLNTDLPPFSLGRGNPARFYGINRVGLERAGFDRDLIRTIETCLKRIYKMGGSSLFDLAREYPISEVEELVRFFKTSKGPVIRGPD